MEKFKMLNIKMYKKNKKDLFKFSRKIGALILWDSDNFFYELDAMERKNYIIKRWKIVLEIIFIL